jgi:F-box-like
MEETSWTEDEPSSRASEPCCTTEASASVTASSSSSSPSAAVLDDSVGILEQILSFVGTADLLEAAAVSRRWRRAGRTDSLWEDAIRRLWGTKRGVYLPPRRHLHGSSDDRPPQRSGNNHGRKDDSGGNSDGGGCGAGTTNGSHTHHGRNHLIFWRALYNKERVRRMTEDEVRGMFQHPLLAQKRALLEESLARTKNGSEGGGSHANENANDHGHVATSTTATTRAFLERFVQLHMLDVLSDETTAAEVERDEHDDDDDDDDVVGCPTNVIPPRPRTFFGDLLFGSFACSVRDGRRQSITAPELCTPFGFETYFKVTEDDLDGMDEAALGEAGIRVYDDDNEDNRGRGGGGGNDADDDGETVLLYRHSTCYFESEQNDRQVRIRLRQRSGNNNNGHSYHPTALSWRWLDAGRRIQVGPYPALTVSRRGDWRWKLENAHVVMYSLDGDDSSDGDGNGIGRGQQP